MAGESGNTGGRGADEPAGERRRRGRFSELVFREPEVDCCPVSEPEFGACGDYRATTWTYPAVFRLTKILLKERENNFCEGGAFRGASSIDQSGA
mgnify:CR=1 FL=1